MVNQSQFIEMFDNPILWQKDNSLPMLSESVNVISGHPFDSELFNTKSEGIPLIRIRDIQRGYTETFTTESFDEQYRIKKGELLIGMDGMFDIARWQSDEAALNQRVCCLRMKNGENDTFIQYFVQPILKHIESGTDATTVKHISTKQINAIRIPVVSKEQKKHFEAIAQLTDKSKFAGFKSQFIEMFEGADAKKHAVGDLCKILAGKTIPLDIENEGGPIAYLKVADMNLPENERVVTTSSRYVSEQTASISGILPIGATVFPKNGAAALHNKKRITSVLTCVDMNIMGVYSISDALDPEFLYAFLEHQDIAGLTLVGAIPQIRAKDVAALEIPVPPIQEQRAYIAIVHQADKSKYLN